MSEGEEVPTAPWYVWLGLIVISAVSFWCQATVTEERFVPALNVIANEFNIPDDIAGATLMAAGASSPELFSSIVALFITHSALGLGTIVGSEIFNQLIICAGAVYAAKSGKLELDRAIVIREVGFYGLSIILLYLALLDHEPLPDDPTGPDHIFISFWDALMVFSGYIAYVIVCGNMEAIVACCTGKKKKAGEKQDLLSNNGNYGTLEMNRETSKRVKIEDVPDLPFLTETDAYPDEPRGNFEQVDYERTFSGLPSAKIEVPGESKESRDSFLARSIRNAVHHYSDGASVRMFSFFQFGDKPSNLHRIHDLEVNTYEERLSCFLWQRSYFYNKALFATHGWYLRWFTFSNEHIYSVPNRAFYEKHRMIYPNFEELQVDEDRLIIKIVNIGKKRHFYWMAPSKEILQAVIKKIEDIMDYRDKLHSEMASVPSFLKDSADHSAEGSGDHLSLVEFPAEGGNLEILFFFFLFPLRLIMHYTVPDVRVIDMEGNPTKSLQFAFLAITSCLVWLVIGSYAMVASLEALAALMNIPDAVVGVTVSAAGTSLPNYVASKVAASNGFGNMAVSNAFGSNTFNIMIGLGMPWVLYTSFATKFEPYEGLQDDGITESVIILGSVLAVFVVLMLQSGFVLYPWHGHFFILLYIAYLAYAIGQVYI